LIPDIPNEYRFNTASVLIFDLKEVKNEKLNVIRMLDFEGSYSASRLIDDRITFVVESWPRYYAYAYEDYGEIDILPVFRDNIKNSNRFDVNCNCKDVGYSDSISAQSLLTVATFDIGDDESEIETVTIANRGGTVYADESGIFIASSNYNNDSEKTIIVTFSTDYEKKPTKKGVENEVLKYNGQLIAPGTILNQFSMDRDQNNFFRIATTSWEYDRSFDFNLSDEDVNDYLQQRVSVNNVYTFDLSKFDIIGDSKLKNVLLPDGSLTGLAPDERIYSTRFMGDKLYMVTFKTVDPLFVIDLSLPKTPKVLGYLKIPGYSKYLHPVNSTHLIGFGKDAEEVHGVAYNLGLKLSLFDVSNYTNPIEVYAHSIGDRGTYSIAEDEHKSFLFTKNYFNSEYNNGVLIFPVDLYTVDGPSHEFRDWCNCYQPTYGSFKWKGLMIYSINEDDFGLVSIIKHGSSGSSDSFSKHNSIERSICFSDNNKEEYLLSLGSSSMAIHKFKNSNFEKLNYLNLITGDNKDEPIIEKTSSPIFDDVVTSTPTSNGNNEEILITKPPKTVVVDVTAN